MCAAAGWLLLPSLQYWRDDRAATREAVRAFEAQSGLQHIRVDLSNVVGSCAVVQVRHSSLKYGYTSVLLIKEHGQWSLKVVADEATGVTFDADDVSAEDHCGDIIQRDREGAARA